MTTPILTEAELPPLPGNLGEYYDDVDKTTTKTYGAEQMRAYGRAVEAKALAKLAAMNEPLFLLHAGQIGSDGEQDEWDIEADSGQRVDDFCRKHPGQSIELFPYPPAAQDREDAAVIKLERHEYQAADLLRRAVRGLRVKRGHFFWSTVRDAFGLGSTCSIALAEWAGLDPDTGKPRPETAGAAMKGTQ